MRRFKHRVLLVLKKVNKVMIGLGKGAGYAINRG